MNENNKFAIGTNSSKASNAGHPSNDLELIEATLLDNISGGGGAGLTSERCRMG